MVMLKMALVPVVSLLSSICRMRAMPSMKVSLVAGDNCKCNSNGHHGKEEWQHNQQYPVRNVGVLLQLCKKLFFVSFEVRVEQPVNIHAFGVHHFPTDFLAMKQNRHYCMASQADVPCQEMHHRSWGW